MQRLHRVHCEHTSGCSDTSAANLLSSTHMVVCQRRVAHDQVLTVHGNGASEAIRCHIAIEVAVSYKHSSIAPLCHVSLQLDGATVRV